MATKAPQNFSATLEPQQFIATVKTNPNPLSGGTPGGPVDAVQFNAGGGAFSGDAGFVYTGGKVGIAQSAPAYALDINGDVNVLGHFYRNGIQLSISSQAVVTGSRAAGVTYENTTGKTMFVMSCWNLGGKNSTINALTDTANPPITMVAEVADTSNSATTVQVFFMVLAGSYYQLQVTAGTPTLVTWTEYT
jgi:hypothetical protein